MLEGLEVSIMKYSQLENEITFGAEYYSKYFISVTNKLKVPELGARALSDITSLITDGDHSATKYEDSGVRYLLSECIKEARIDLEKSKFISQDLHKSLKRSSLKYKDILVTKTGVYFGLSAVVPDNFGDANTSAHVGIIRIKNKSEFNPYYVSSFLNSKYGHSQLRRRGLKVSRPEIKLLEFKEILIPFFSSKLQNEIESIIFRGSDTLKASELEYGEAENILLQELGLSNWQPTIKNNNTKTLNESFLYSGRIDAEYYQPKYDELERSLLKNKHYRIKEIKTFNARGLQPIYDVDGTLDVINSKHILDKNLDYGNFEKTNIDNWELQERARVYKDDILTYTTGANIGRTQTYLVDNPALASNHVNILRVKGINPVYAGFVINSIIGRLQTEKYSAGSAQLELYPKDLDEFIIPVIDDKIQKTIADKIQQSFALRSRSHQLLEVAKKAVEIAIEENEQTALNHLIQHA